MKKILVSVIAALALAAPAAASRTPIPVPGGPIVVTLDPACVAYATAHNLPIIYCVIH